MTDDAKYLYDLFIIQLGNVNECMLNKKLSFRRFDRYSYGKWAIIETVEAIRETPSCVSVKTIRDILKYQIMSYEMYYNADEERQKRYLYAMEMCQYLLKLTGGYLLDE